MNLLFPHEYYRSSYEIPYEDYLREGYKAILFDIDNTLVPHDMPATVEAIELIHRLKSIGFQVIVVSNNNELRAGDFATQCGISFVADAKKPSRAGYIRAMETLESDPTTSLFVGDQLFTDIYGARRAGMYAICVARISPKEPFHIHCKRALERVIRIFDCRTWKKGGLYA